MANNGLTTQSDLLTVTNGDTTINGGTLLVGYTEDSLGLVTNNFSPIAAARFSGEFTQAFDAGGNILLLAIDNGIVTVLGASPRIPDTLFDELLGFLNTFDSINELIASNQAQVEDIINALLEEEIEDSSQVCN